MIESLFTWLSQALYATPLLAVGTALLWGVLSILLSPCHLTSIPLIIGFINGQGKITTRRAFWLSALFSIGILITIGLIGLITGLLGRMLGDIGSFGRYFVAVIFIVVGLYLMELISLPFLNFQNQPKLKKRGLAAAFILGLIFGIALGPCTFAYMAPILAMVFSVSSTNLSFGILLLLMYAIGHCAVIVLAGTFTEVLRRYLQWNEQSQTISRIKKICGILVILGGIYLIFT